MRRESTIIEGKKVTLYLCDQVNAPVVYSNDFGDSAEAVLAACRQMECPEFHLVSITKLRWDEELSPWPQNPIVAKDDHFTGEADSYLDVLEHKILPYVQGLVPESKVNILNGYSMGGLFALYAAHHSKSFDAYAAPSASVWYPKFKEYVEENSFERKPECIYLSIGDRESRTKNPYFSQTESNMEQLLKIYTDRKIKSFFELNQGNHYKDVPLRIAKGLNWILLQMERKGD